MPCFEISSEIDVPVHLEPGVIVKTPVQPNKTAERKSHSNKKYSWRRDNPKGEDFISEKCAAVKYRRAQHVKENIYEEGVKLELRDDSDQMFLKVWMKVDSL
ncbi:hypothetical protein MHBO_005050 [Bonamia ostreae]|uniref:Uncharacterized protein n=1 Tax=Bonamia ostreae TaxID=126728 RepID=A0ABV2AUZ7_9EUKA